MGMFEIRKAENGYIILDGQLGDQYQYGRRMWVAANEQACGELLAKLLLELKEKTK